jgi:hypothetical protein
MKYARRPDYFWISYSDLMTSLFFIMLVLFVLAKVEWDKVKIELEEEKEKAVKNYEDLKRISESINKVEGEYFKYDSDKRSFSLKADTIKFGTAKTELSSGAKTHLTLAGRELAEKIRNLEKEYKAHDVRYTVVLEGMSSEDKNIGKTLMNYQFSYERAWQVKQLWDNAKINFSPTTEIQISGTGIDGLGMVLPKSHSSNQRILIHVVPKIGKFNVEQ